MSVAFLGTKSVGSFAKSLPTLALPQLLAFLNELLRQQGDIKARLAVYAQISGVALADPATLIAQITAAIAAMKDQVAAIVAGFIPVAPTFSVNASADLALLLPKIAALQLILDQLNAAVSLGGVHLLHVDSTPAAVGSELASVVSGGINGGLPTSRIQGVIAVTESPATYAAMTALFLTE